MKKRILIGCVLALSGLVVACTNPGPESSLPIGTVSAAAGSPSLGEGIDRTGLGEGHTVMSGVPSESEHMKTLQELRLFEVGALLVELPAEAYQCYGLCPEWEDELEAQRAEQEARLADLAAVARSVHESETLPEADASTTGEHLEALSALTIVAVGELIVDEAASSPYCYNLPCPGDIAAADASNARRAKEIAELARLTEEL